MKKFALLPFSLLILIIGVGIASATDINATIDDAVVHADQCSVDEIETLENNAPDNIIVSVGNKTDVSGSIVDKNTSIASAGNPNEKQKTVPTVGIKDPKPIDLSPENQNSLKKDIAKYNKYFQDKHLKKWHTVKCFPKES